MQRHHRRLFSFLALSVAAGASLATSEGFVPTDCGLSTGPTLSLADGDTSSNSFSVSYSLAEDVTYDVDVSVDMQVVSSADGPEIEATLLSSSGDVVASATVFDPEKVSTLFMSEYLNNETVDCADVLAGCTVNYTVEVVVVGGSAELSWEARAQVWTNSETEESVSAEVQVSIDGGTESDCTGG